MKKGKLCLGLALAVTLFGCAQSASSSGASSSSGVQTQEMEDVVNFHHSLDGYTPEKTSYNFYMTYKIVHPWWDAVAMGIEDAVSQFEDAGITITYEYLAPTAVSAEDQKERVLSAAKEDFDVIGVDVADIDTITPVINSLIDDGHKVMTFSSSDATKADGCKRIAFVGNTHNYEDGTDLTEALCKKLGYKGKVAILVGDTVPCHEDRAEAAQDVIRKYSDMEVVEIEYDHDSVENAYELTKTILEKHDDLAGMVCCNMSNPVGAAQAVEEAGKQDQVTIVGMDHDQRALTYLEKGTIYCLGIQDCYSIGFDTIQTAVKIADGLKPGDAYPEIPTNIKTTLVYQEQATAMKLVLYGESQDE